MVIYLYFKAVRDIHQNYSLKITAQLFLKNVNLDFIYLK